MGDPKRRNEVTVEQGKKFPNPQRWNRETAEWRKTLSSQTTELREMTRRPKYYYKTSCFREEKSWEKIKKIKTNVKSQFEIKPL